jgi:hypothetical protein
MKSIFGIIILAALTLLPLCTQAESNLEVTMREYKVCEGQMYEELEQLFTTAVLEHSERGSEARFALERLTIIQSEMINFLATDQRMHSVVETFNAGIVKVIVKMLAESSKDQDFRQKYIQARKAAISKFEQCIKLEG